MAGADNPITEETGLQGEHPSHTTKGRALSGPGGLSGLQAQLIELAHDAIFIRELDGRIVTWNQGAQALYGWTEQEALGQPKHHLLHTRFPVSLEAVNQALEEEGFWEGLLQHTTRQGRQVIVQSRQVLVRDEAGQPIAILEINRDVTEQERLIRESAEAEAREVALHETIRQMDKFLSLVSHELRTPVTSLKTQVQLLLRRPERAARAASDGTAEYARGQAELLRRANRQINRLTRLLDDLLDLSRIREGKLELRMEPGDLSVWVQEAVEEEALAHPDRRILFEPAPEGPLPVLADLDRIGQVVTNYLTNALKYSPSDRPVRVRLQRQGAEARVEVQDEGPGIPAEAQAQVWELFQRVPGIEVVSGSGVGLGLGLYLCKSLVERHGGQVGVESAPGQGSCFWFTLPLAAEGQVRL
jgi:PAS domain S-box-containing protein